jgi:hypothetical protein
VVVRIHGLKLETGAQNASLSLVEKVMGRRKKDERVRRDVKISKRDFRV